MKQAVLSTFLGFILGVMTILSFPQVIPGVSAYTALEQSITASGMNQGDLVQFLTNVKDLVNELQTDHATERTVVADIKSLANTVRNKLLNQPLDPANFEISTNFDIQNGDAFDCMVDGEIFTVSTDQAFDTGTTTPIATNAQWAGALLSSDCESATPTTYVDWGAEAASEAAAITGLASVTASGSVVLGYATVQAHASNPFVAGTDALAGGAGGNVAQTTNYYNRTKVGDATVGAAVSTSPPATLSESTSLSLVGGQ